jgi:hypothetical protein
MNSESAAGENMVQIKQVDEKDCDTNQWCKLNKQVLQEEFKTLVFVFKQKWSSLYLYHECKCVLPVFY